MPEYLVQIEHGRGRHTEKKITAPTLTAAYAKILAEVTAGRRKWALFEVRSQSIHYTGIWQIPGHPPERYKHVPSKVGCSRENKENIYAIDARRRYRVVGYWSEMFSVYRYVFFFETRRQKARKWVSFDLGTLTETEINLDKRRLKNFSKEPLPYKANMEINDGGDALFVYLVWVNEQDWRWSVEVIDYDDSGSGILQWGFETAQHAVEFSLRHL